MPDSNNPQQPKAYLAVSKKHARIAVTSYSNPNSSEPLYRAHLTASYIAMLGDHKLYVEHCERNGIVKLDNEWKKEIT